jgi:hypothetical protein
MIRKAGTKYGVDPEVLAAIALVESDFRSGRLACWPVTLPDRCEPTCDYGLAQVNQLWITKWGLSPCRLLRDDQYNLEVASRILRDLKKRYPDEPNYWSRYHDSRPDHREPYEKTVMALLEGVGEDD